MAKTAKPSGGSGAAPPGLRLPRALRLLLALVTAAGLAVDAYVHADFASSYDRVGAGGLTEGELFRAEAAVSALAALLVLVFVARRFAWTIAFVVAAAGVAAVIVYVYVDVGAFGPVPDMYEPAWYPEKTASAIGEGIAAGTALIGLLLTLFIRRRTPAAAGSRTSTGTSTAS